MSPFDTRVPAVVLRTDRNPFHHGTLGAVRSLGRAGVPVHLVADCADSPVGASRYLRRLHTPPPPGASPADILQVLRRVAAGLDGPAVLVPMDDASAIAVARGRAELTPHYLLPELPGPLPERLADKAELAAVCAALDIPHPVTVLPDSAAEAARAAEALGPPVVAKWSRPWLLPPGGGLRSTRLVRSARQVRELYARADEAGGRLLLQAFLPPGPDRDWFFHGYADHRGVLRAGGTGLKTRARPRGAGLTAVGRWAADPGVRALAERIVGELGYRGVLDLDFRRCGSTGRFHLLDFNPRPGAQFRLFTDTAGLDVVRALHLDLTGRALPVGAAVPGRVFVAENYAPPAALRPAPGGRELAWHARDDRGPGRALWRLWSRHAADRLAHRLRRPAPTPDGTGGSRAARGADGTADRRAARGPDGTTEPRAAREPYNTAQPRAAREPDSTVEPRAARGADGTAAPRAARGATTARLPHQADPADPVGPADQADLIDPAGPADPGGPVAPADPVDLGGGERAGRR